MFHIHVYNLDGTLFHIVDTIEYIEEFRIIDNLLVIRGFMWQPLFMIQIRDLNKLLLKEQYAPPV